MPLNQPNFKTEIQENPIPNYALDMTRDVVGFVPLALLSFLVFRCFYNINKSGAKKRRERYSYQRKSKAQ